MQDSIMDLKSVIVPLLPFLLVMVFFLIIEFKKFVKTKQKKHLLVLMGMLLTISGLMISQVNQFLGSIILKSGYLVFMVGLFIAHYGAKQENKKKGLFYNPTFVIISVSFCSLLLIGFGIYIAWKNHEYIQGAVAILFGIGMTVNTIIRKGRS